MADENSRPAQARVFAPAKVNLCLHITGRRDDGYHLLDSIVSFADVGDRLFITHGNLLSLTVEGPEAAGVPADMHNLAMRAARLFAVDDGFALTLAKHLPAASGIGGGSADAAAAIRGVLAMRGDGIATLFDASDALLAPFAQEILALGADVPMCLMSKPARVRGIGETIDFLPLWDLPTVLVNPRVPVSTASVFAGLMRADNPPLPEVLPDFSDLAGFVAWLCEQRNDLEAPAIAATPVIADVLNALGAQPGCDLARMSGSGATCFGLFGDVSLAKEAAARLFQNNPDWWVTSGVLGNQLELAAPKIS